MRFAILACLLAAVVPAQQDALLFHASFDKGVDADVAAGDPRIYTAPAYKVQLEAKPGLDHPDVSIAKGAGKTGDALWFHRKNTRAVFYKADKNPAFHNRLVVVRKYPFAKGQWTHVAIAFSARGSGKSSATLYLNGEKRGETPAIADAFSWDPALAALRVGVNYVGLFDEFSVYRRPLTDAEIRRLYQAAR